MTELLQRAIAEIEKLPAEEQNAIATRILAELKDEQAWKMRFAATTDHLSTTLIYNTLVLILTPYHNCLEYLTLNKKIICIASFA